MKISKLISILSKVMEEDGDNEVQLNVHDYYTRYGRSAHLILSTEGHVWTGITTNPSIHQTTVDVYLDEITDFATNEVLHPKITFRKS